MEDTSYVFVFGSNLAGRHGKGAALTARMHFGAVYGQGVGLQGRSYAIPTKGFKMETLRVQEIKGWVDKFIKFARNAYQINFRVTAIGTGLAGYSHEDIAPMFYDAPLNCTLPIAWKKHLDTDGRKYWSS